MPNLRIPTGRTPWHLLVPVLAAQFAVLCLAWALTDSAWVQALLLLTCLFPLLALSGRAAETNPFPARTESEARQRELLLSGGFIALLFGFGAGVSLALKVPDLYPGPYAVAYLAAWVPLAVAWNLLGYQRFSTSEPTD
jgi:hypothetical protein